MRTKFFFGAFGAMAASVGVCAADLPATVLQRFAESMWHRQHAVYNIDRLNTANGQMVHAGLVVLRKPDRFYYVAYRADGKSTSFERASNGAEAWTWGESRDGKIAYQTPLVPLGQAANYSLPEVFGLFFNPDLTSLDPSVDARYEASILASSHPEAGVTDLGRVMLGKISAQRYGVEIKGSFGAWPLVEDHEDWPSGISDIAGKGAQLALADNGDAFAYRNSDNPKDTWLLITPAVLSTAEEEKYFALHPPADAQVWSRPTKIVQLGDKPKDFTLPDLYGKPVNLYETVKSHKATVIVDFPANCFGCHIELVWAEKLHELYANQGLAVICVTGVADDVARNQIYAKRYPGGIKDANRGTSSEWELSVGLYRHFKRIFAPAATVQADTMQYPVLIDSTWDEVAHHFGDVRKDINGRYHKVNTLVLDPQGRIVYFSGPRLAYGGPTKAFLATLEQLGVIDEGAAGTK